MSDLSCVICGKNATIGYCEKCERETYAYCASLRNRIKELETLLERIRELQISDGASLGWAQKIAYEALDTEAQS